MHTELDTWQQKTVSLGCNTVIHTFLTVSGNSLVLVSWSTEVPPVNSYKGRELFSLHKDFVVREKKKAMAKDKMFTAKGL